jgi:predicted nucleic acid-binding protein
MDIYIVDSNLVFSSVLNVKNGIGQFILKSKENNISLYAPRYLEKEINRHFPKIIDRSKLNEEEIKQVIQKIY